MKTFRFSALIALFLCNVCFATYPGPPTGTGAPVNQDAPTINNPTETGVKTYTGTTNGTNTVTVTSGTSITNNNVVTVTPTANTTATYMGRADQITYTGSADITGGGHPIGGFHYGVMNAPGHTAALLIPNEGKLYVQAGTLTSGASVHCGLQDVASGAVLSNYVACNAQISDVNGTLSVATGYSLTVVTTHVAIPIMRQLYAPDYPTGTATNYAMSWCDITIATNHFCVYSPGTAQNYLKGRTTIGTVTDDGANQLQVTGNAKITGNIVATGTGTIPVYGFGGLGIANPHMAVGSCALSAGSCTITFVSSAIFTNSASYICTANDNTGLTAVKVVNVSGTQATFTGTGTDTVSFVCVGS